MSHTLQDIAQFMVIAVLAGLFWLQKGKNQTVAGAQQVTGLLFFELLFLSLRALFTALFTFPSDYKMARITCTAPRTQAPAVPCVFGESTCRANLQPIRLHW